MTRNKTILLFVFVSSVSFILLSQSGITSDHIFNPLGLSTKILSSGGLGISWPFMILFILIFPLSYSIIGLYSISSEDVDYALLAAPLLVTPLVFYYAGLSLSAFLISAGFISSVLLAQHIAHRDKENYKKISIYSITAKSATNAIFIIDLALVLVVYLSLILSPTGISDRFRSDLGDAVGAITPESAMLSLQENRKQELHSIIEFTEISILSSMESGLDGLTGEESAKCSAGLAGNLESIDTETKSQLDNELERQMNKTQSAPILPDTMVDQFSFHYLLLIVVAFFISLESLRVLFLARLAGIYAWLFSVLFDTSADDSAPAPSSSAHSESTIPSNHYGSRLMQYKAASNPYYDTDNHLHRQEKKGY